MSNQKISYKETGEELLNKITAATSVKVLYQGLYNQPYINDAEVIKEAILGGDLDKIAFDPAYSPYFQAVKFKEHSIYSIDDYSEEEIAFAIENLILGFIKDYYDNIIKGDLDRSALKGAVLSYKAQYYNERIKRMGDKPPFNHQMRRVRRK